MSAVSFGGSVNAGSCCDGSLDKVMIEEMEEMIALGDDDPDDRSEETTEYEDDDVNTDENENDSEDGSSGILTVLYAAQ